MTAINIMMGWLVECIKYINIYILYVYIYIYILYIYVNEHIKKNFLYFVFYNQQYF